MKISLENSFNLRGEAVGDLFKKLSQNSKYKAVKQDYMDRKKGQKLKKAAVRSQIEESSQVLARQRNSLSAL